MSAKSMQFIVPAGNLAGVNSPYAEVIQGVVDTGNLIGGEQVIAFENELAIFLGSKYALSLASGMDALIIALKALELPEKSNVVVADNAGGYASLAVLSAGHRPVFCDVQEHNFLIGLDNIQTYKSKIDAIVVTHLYGQMANMFSLVDWAKSNKVPIIEDCAQSFGAVQNEKRAGTFGTIGGFSYYPTKNLGGIGDGGAICTDDHDLANRVHVLRQYGWTKRYNIESKGGRNSRLDSINAAVLRVKLRNIDQENDKRREIFKKYLSSAQDSTFFHNKIVSQENVVHLAVGTYDTPEDMISFFKTNGVELTRHYPIRDSDQKGLNYLGVDLPTPLSQKLCNTVISVPLYPWLTDDQISHVCASLEEWGKRVGR